MARLDITNIDLDEIHVTGLGQNTGTTVSLDDADVRAFGGAQQDPVYSGGTVNQASGTQIGLHKFRNARVPEYFASGAAGMVAKTGYGNVSAYFAGMVQSGFSTGGILNYTSGSSYNNDFQANAALFGKTENLLLSQLRNSTTISRSNATPGSGDVTLTIGGNYDSSKGALGTSFGTWPSASDPNYVALVTAITNAATAYLSNTGWTQLVLTDSSGTVKYLQRANATFTATTLSDPALFATAGTHIYAAVSYTWANETFTRFFGSPYAGQTLPYSNSNTYYWTVHLE